MLLFTGNECALYFSLEILCRLLWNVRCNECALIPSFFFVLITASVECCYLWVMSALFISLWTFCVDYSGMCGVMSAL